MELKELEEFVDYEIERLNEAYKAKDSNELPFWAAIKIMEEAGELATDFLKFKGYQRKEKLANFDIAHMGEEVSDVIMVTMILAHRCGINVEEAIKNKIEIIKKRSYKIESKENSQT